MTTAATHAEPRRNPPVRRLARNFAFMLGGQLLIKTFGFLFSVYVVRHLGDTHFGQYAAALAYVAIFAAFTDPGTSELSMREIARKRENAAWMVPDIMTLRVILSLLMIAGCTVSAWLLGKPPDMVLAILIASCGVLLYAVQGPLDCLLIAEERLDVSAMITLLNQAVFIVLGTTLLLLGLGYVGLALASLIGVVVMGCASLSFTIGVLRVRFQRPDPRRWGRLLRASLPFGVAGTANVFARRFDTVFMSFVLTDAAVGWYNVSFQLTMMLLLLAQGLAISLYPSLVKQYDSGRGTIRSTVQATLRYLLLLAMPLAVGGMLLADRIMVVLYGATFAAAAPVMRVLIWSLPPLFLAEILGRTSSTMHLERRAARASVARALIGGTLVVLLVPRAGVVGAAVATVAARIVGLLQSVVIIGPATLLEDNVGPLLRVVGASSIMGAVIWGVRDTVFAARDGTIPLLLMIGLGAAVYGAAALALQAIRPGEARYVYDVGRHGLAQLGRDK